MLHLRCGGESRGGAGGGAPLFLVQTEARRVENNVFETAPLPLSWDLDDRASPPPLCEGLDPPLRRSWELSVCITAEFQPNLGDSFMSKCCH